MFHQIIAPVGGNLLLSFIVAAIPIAAVLIILGLLRRPAWQASSIGLAIALVLAIFVWRLPPAIALNSAVAGATFALWPVMWIVFNALILYNIAVISGRFEAFRDWLVANLPNDRRVVLVVIGFSFGCLIALGFPAIDALVFTLMFNTAPVAFGALGAPITTLAAVTQLPDHTLGAMIGRQLPFIAVLLPFYVTAVYAGARGLRGVWPVLLVAGGSFGITQFICSNYLGYALTDVLSSLTSLALTLGFLRVWHMPHDPAFALAAMPESVTHHSRKVGGWHGWAPWLILSVVVIAWIHLKVNLLGQIAVQWPGLHNAVFITAYNKPYAAVWNFQPLATGTAILFASLITAVVVGLRPAQFVTVVSQAVRQVRLPAFTTMLIVGLAYLMNYSGMAYTLGIGVASAGLLFPLLSAFLGWLAVFLSGSDTSGNALFGNLQVVAAQQLGLSPVLMAATNSSGGVMGKMISPQNICTGTVVTDLAGREGEVLARTFKHSVILTVVLGLLVVLQQYVFPGMIPS
jgi:lactate permease